MNALSALSERLSTVASLIPSCEIVVDVGSDHGKLSAWCLQSWRCKRIVATDIHKLPAERTREKLFVEGLSEQSEVRVADGLSGVELQSDMTVVIAGMGGLEICKILREAMDSCENTAGGKCGQKKTASGFHNRKLFFCL